MKEKDSIKLSPEDSKRIVRSAQQIASYAAFLRWNANFTRDELKTHKSHDKIYLLSQVQSSRFVYALDGSTIMLGVQDFEAAWIAHMPFDSAYITDRLYLTVGGVSCMEVNFPPLAIGIHISDQAKREELRGGRFVQPVRVQVESGQLTSVGGVLGLGVPIRKGDVIGGLLQEAKERMKTQDVSRFF